MYSKCKINVGSSITPGANSNPAHLWREHSGKPAPQGYLTNFALAQEDGFNSKSAFFGLFKKITGMTPGEFKRLHH